MDDKVNKGSGELDGETGLLSKPDAETIRPSLFKVLILNDDYTPMEFVVHVLQKFFKKNEAEAVKIMLTIHKSGRGLAGIYIYSIAELKVKQVNDYAAQFEFPLLSVCEKE